MAGGKYAAQGLHMVSASTRLLERSNFLLASSIHAEGTSEGTRDPRLLEKTFRPLLLCICGVRRFIEELILQL